MPIHQWLRRLLCPWWSKCWVYSKSITSANSPICKRKGGPSSCTSASWPAGEGRPWCYAGNATRTFTPDAGTEQRPKKAVTGKPDDIERVTSGLAGGRRERSRKTTSPAAYPTTSARTSSETVGGDDELHRAYKSHRFVVKDLRGKSRAHSVCGCAFFLGDRSIRDPSR